MTVAPQIVKIELEDIFKKVKNLENQLEEQKKLLYIILFIVFIIMFVLVIRAIKY